MTRVGHIVRVRPVRPSIFQPSALRKKVRLSPVSARAVRGEIPPASGRSRRHEGNGALGMTASDAALSDSASADRRPPESYSRLWQPPGRRAVHRQALGQPYVWAGSEDPALPEDPGPGSADMVIGADRSQPVSAGPPQRNSALWPDRADQAANQPGKLTERGRSHRRRSDPLAGATTPTERAVIGDSLRVPMAWCQAGSCVAWYADPSALGEADVRARALAAGWCVDAFGQLACPSCQQRDYLWSASPLVPRTGRGPDPGSWSAREASAAGRHRVQY